MSTNNDINTLVEAAREVLAFMDAKQNRISEVRRESSAVHDALVENRRELAAVGDRLAGAMDGFSAEISSLCEDSKTASTLLEGYLEALNKLRTVDDSDESEDEDEDRKKHVKWAYEEGFVWNERTCAHAAKNGNLRVLKYAHENGCPLDLPTCAWAAEGGHLECLQYFMAHADELADDRFKTWACNFAARGGHLKCLKFAYENNCDIGDACYHAAVNGHLECFKYALAKENPDQLGINVVEEVISEGHLAMLEWLQTTGTQFDTGEVCNLAAAYGEFGILKWARDNKFPWGNTCSNAAWGGNLEILKWARQHGCPWPDDMTCTEAAGYNGSKGHYDVLVWCRDNGCPGAHMFDDYAQDYLYDDYRDQQEEDLDESEDDGDDKEEDNDKGEDDAEGLDEDGEEEG